MAGANAQNWMSLPSLTCKPRAYGGPNPGLFLPSGATAEPAFTPLPRSFANFFHHIPLRAGKRVGQAKPAWYKTLVHIVASGHDLPYATWRPMTGTCRVNTFCRVCGMLVPHRA